MNIKQQDQIGVFKIAATYIGTVVGAGFASGQEVLQFFAAFGFYGILGIVVATLLFFFFGYTILVLGRKLNADSHDDIILYSNGKIVGRIIDIIIFIFLFVALSAMIAGSGAIVTEQFGFSPYFGMGIMAIVTLITVISGTKGVVNAISYVVPVLLLSVLLICFYSIYKNPISLDKIQQASELKGATPNWILSAFNYASYNLVIAVAVLGPLGRIATNKASMFKGALLGAVGLGIGIIAIYYSLIANIGEVIKFEVPMVQIASEISRWVQIFFAGVLLAEVYTTAVGNLYGFVSRIAFIGEKYRVLSIVLTTIAAFLLAQIGFSAMVKYLYPSVGYGGLLMFIGLTYYWFKKRKVVQ
jgi:uncharacterized membrane protein YkvI